MTPRQQQLDALAAQQLLVAQQGDDLVPKQPLGGRLTDEGHRHEVALRIPSAAGGEGVHVRVPAQHVAVGLHDGHHPGLEGRITDGARHELGDHLPARPAEASQQLPMMKEEDPQHLRDRERPQSVTDVLGHLRG